MKRRIMLLTLFIGIGLFLLPLSESYAQMGPGMTGPGMMGQRGGYGYGQWNYCPYCGQPLTQGPYGMGPGMMGPGMMGGGMMGPGMMGPGMMGGGMMGPGMMGPGMMGGGGMMGPGMMGPGQGMGPQYGPQGQQKPLTEEEAKGLLQNYLMSTRNPNLTLGKIQDKGNGFEAEIVTKKEGALVDKIFVDKYTGWMRSIY
ncbi:MAG: hypothetical protein JRJ03_06005 [Deltaproteobacteria bacterium]|nr:hypothetical protein [Deltaproteobacteria bacterium]